MLSTAFIRVINLPHPVTLGRTWKGVKLLQVYSQIICSVRIGLQQQYTPCTKADIIAYAQLASAGSRYASV